MRDVGDTRFSKAGQVPRALGVEVVVLDRDDRLLEEGRNTRQVDVNVPVAGVVEDLDEVACGVIDVGVDLWLHVGDRRGVRQLALVGVIAREDGADRAGSDRSEDRDEDQHDAEDASAPTRLPQVAVGARAAAPELRASGCLGGADAWIGRSGRAHGSPRAVGKARPAAPSLGPLLEAHP